MAQEPKRLTKEDVHDHLAKVDPDLFRFLRTHQDAFEDDMEITMLSIEGMSIREHINKSRKQ